MLNVGEFRNRTYSPLWVQNLKSMVERTTGGCRFVCLSNVAVEGVETIPLTDSLPGWWSKIELWKPGQFTGRVLYLDLDVLVLKNLAPLIDCAGEFVAMDAQYEAPTRLSEGKRVTAGLNSGTLCWTPCEATERLYTGFRRKYMDELRGDQDWITEQYEDPAFFPTEWFMRLRQCPGGPPDHVRVLHCMPHKNDVAAKKYKWVRDIWA